MNSDAERVERGQHPSVNGCSLDGVTAVVLPGSGSDDVFVRAAFNGPLRSLGVRLVAPRPLPGADVVGGHRAALDEALARVEGPVLVGGISVGAHIAAAWAAAHATSVAGLLLALPGWTGHPGDAPAALAARATADELCRGGLRAAVDAARSGAPAWLVDDLERSWRGHGPGLVATLIAAAAEPAPDDDLLASLTMPVGVVGLCDDAVHPLAVARHWCTRLPNAVLLTSTLDTLGADRAVLGRAAALGWLLARSGNRRTRASGDLAAGPPVEFSRRDDGVLGHAR